MVEKLLARLAGKICNMEGTTGFSPASLTDSDISAAISGLKDYQYAYLDLQYLGGQRATQSTHKLAEYLKSVDKSKGKQRNRQIPLAILAIREQISPRLCYACRGRGVQISREGLHKDCGVCEATGKLPWKARDRAKAIGVDANGWRKYSARYLELLRQLQIIDGQICRHIRRKLQ